MLTYEDMYREVWAVADKNQDDNTLDLLYEWFDLSDGRMLTAGQTKRLKFLADFIRNQYHAIRS